MEHINGLLVVKETYRSDSDGGEGWCRLEWELFLESEITHYSSLQALDNCKEGAKRTGSAPWWVLMHSRLRSLDPVLLCRVTEYPPSASISSCEDLLVRGTEHFRRFGILSSSRRKGMKIHCSAPAHVFRKPGRLYVSHCPYPSLQTLNSLGLKEP